MIDVAAADPGEVMDSEVELLRVVAELTATLITRGEAADGLRRLPEETIADLDGFAIPSLTRPRAYGGQQASLLTILGVLEELARGCASTSFVACVYTTSPWLTTLFSEPPQEEVFTSENPRTAIAFTPGGGVLQRGDDYIKDPLPRIVRDMHALSLHAFLVPATATELHGRILCGVEPGAAFL